MTSIIAAKTADVQYAIVGTCLNLEKQVQNVAQTGAAFDTKIAALEAAVAAVKAAS